MDVNDASGRLLLEALVSRICDGATACHLDGSLVNEIGPLVEQATLEAKSAEQLLAEAFHPSRRRLLDFGCGAAHHRGFIEGLGYAWQGADVLAAVSPLAVEEVMALASQIALYDGQTLPFDHGVFDVVWALLVLHHVRHIDVAFDEIARVLVPGGRLIGQISCMEQMQDYGTFNFTPYGLKTACASAGLALVRVYPKHDVFSFLARRLFIILGGSDDNEFTGMLDPDGILHQKLIGVGRKLRMSNRDINLLRLKFSMQYVFEVVKP